MGACPIDSCRQRADLRHDEIEQAAALAWNGALRRAAGRSGRWSLYYLNVYNAFAGGQAGGFSWQPDQPLEMQPGAQAPNRPEPRERAAPGVPRTQVYPRIPAESGLLGTRSPGYLLG